MEEFKVNEDFARRYNEYRKREEFDKLKNRYGDVSIKENDDQYSASESSESEDSEAELWTADDEKSFLRVYSALLRKDPEIYNQNKKWYKEKVDDEEENNDADTKKNDKKILFKDYQREFLIKKGGVLDEDQEQQGVKIAKTDSDVFLKTAKRDRDSAKLDHLKAKFHQGFESDSEDEFLKPREQNSENEESDGDDDEEVLRYLRGEVEDIADVQLRKELDPLKEMWSKSNNESDRYLKEYLTNKLWKSKNSDRIPTYKEIVGDGKDDDDDEDDDSMEDAEEIDRLSEDEAFLKKATDFENKWNNQVEDPEFESQYSRTTAKYRFEEGDDLLKQYPRVIEDSLRQSKGETRAQREQRRKERKYAEMEAKYKEIEELKHLKMQEITSRLEKIQRTCGSKDLKNIDPSVLDDDWDPDKHDELVKKVFGNDYYEVAEDEKPVFSSSDDESAEEEIDWDKWKGPNCKQTEIKKPTKRRDKESVCGLSDNGNVDDPSHEGNDEVVEEEEEHVRSRRRKRRGRGNLLRKALEKKKPTFDARNYPGFEEYFDEVYQLDCEDILPGMDGEPDIRCRYNYREVEPNDFGLTVDEILAAKDKELNAWVSVKKMSRYRSKEEDRKDKQIYWSRKKQSKKNRIIQSLTQPDSLETGEDENENSDLKNVNSEAEQETMTESQSGDMEIQPNSSTSRANKNKRKKKKKNTLNDEKPAQEISLKASVTPNEPNQKEKSKKKKKRKTKEAKDIANDTNKDESNDCLQPPKKIAKKEMKPVLNPSRLEALALNPKSYKHLKVKHA